MVKGFAQCWTEAGEEPDAENSHVQAVSERHGDGVFDFVRLILRLRLRDCREQDDGEGVGDGGRKEDKGGKRYNRDKVRKTDVNAVIYRVFLILSLFLYQYVLFLI